MSLGASLQTSSSAVAALAEDLDTHWFVTDLYTRILTGDIFEPEDALELMEEALEDEGTESLPDVTAAAVEDDADAFTEELVEAIWNAAHETAQAWEDQSTDTDRFFGALDALDDLDIDSAVYADHADIEAREGQRGVCVLWVNAWEQFDHTQAVETLLSVASRDDSVTNEEIAADVTESLVAQGLKVIAQGEDSVTVSLQWRVHVDSWEDANSDDFDEDDLFDDDDEEFEVDESDADADEDR